MYEGMNINCHTNVELVDGEFLRVKDIIRDTRTSSLVLRGWLFRRTREMNGLLERKTNEICWTLHIDEDDRRELSVQGMESIPITQVRKRRSIRMTNRPYPELSWREDGIENQEVILNDRVLVCRYKYVCSYADADARKQNKWCAKALIRLQRAECDATIGIEDEALRYTWRGETLKGGSWKDLAAGERERQCNQNSQPAHIPSTFPRSGPSKGRHESLASPVGGLHELQTLDFTRDDNTVLQDTSAEIVKRSPEFTIYAVHQSKSKPGKGKTQSKNYIDLTSDDISPNLQASTGSRGNRSKASNGSFFPFRRRHSSEVVEIPPPIASSSRLEGHQSREAGQINQSCPSGGTGAKRSMDQTHWSQHRPSKRLAKSRQTSQQRYTFGDCFCGAGGTARGAMEAGLHINWGFDFNHPACQSFKLNFPAARVYNVWAHDFVSLPDQEYDHKVDICHLSPPCQYFSDAHTVAGRDDEMNTATLFSVSKLLEKAKPRVVTLEQTAGLLRRHSPFFNALVLMFTERGFSIRWRLLQCADYGLPQHRLRLFMIASW